MLVKEEASLTLSDNVAGDIIAEREIASDCNQQIDGTGSADTAEDDRRCLKMRVILNLVQNGEHLQPCQVDRHMEEIKGPGHSRFGDKCMQTQ